MPVHALPHGRATAMLERTHPACGSQASCLRRSRWQLTPSLTVGLLPCWSADIPVGGSQASCLRRSRCQCTPSLTVGLLPCWSAGIPVGGSQASCLRRLRCQCTPPHGRATAMLERTHPACGSQASCLRRLRCQCTPSLTVGLLPLRRSWFVADALFGGRPILHLHDLRLAGSIHRHHKKIVILALSNRRILWSAKRGDDLRHSIVMSGNQDRLT